MPGYVIDESAVAARATTGDTVSTRIAIDASCGCEQLEQRVIRFAPGRSQERLLEDHQEVMYVAEGNGTITVNGEPHALEPDTGVYLTPGDRYSVENPGPGELLAVSVAAPHEQGGNGDHGVVVRYAERPVLPAKPNREFRFLVDRDMGCRDVTQFVGVIPPGRAPDHSHTYDEVVYVIEGEGIVHLPDGDTPIGAGSCIHLPPLVEHSLENTGANNMRVLGVFYPQGDPASRAHEAQA
jgi:mannose-6-phosphate isomerase-like protein (cupin superfamily)